MPKKSLFPRLSSILLIIAKCHRISNVTEYLMPYICNMYSESAIWFCNNACVIKLHVYICAAKLRNVLETEKVMVLMDERGETKVSRCTWMRIVNGMCRLRHHRCVLARPKKKSYVFIIIYVGVACDEMLNVFGFLQLLCCRTEIDTISRIVCIKINKFSWTWFMIQLYIIWWLCVLFLMSDFCR